MSVIKHSEQRVGIFIDTQNLYHTAKNLYGAKVNFGQVVKDALADRALIRAVAYVITTETVGVGITTDNQITRYNLKGVIDYTLTDRASGERLTGGRVQNFTAYAATGSTVAGLAAEEDAGLRLMRILADQITARLIAASATLP